MIFIFGVTFYLYSTSHTPKPTNMIGKNSIYKWTGVALTGFILLVCCSFFIYNAQISTDNANLGECVVKKKKKNKMVWEDLSSRFFSPSEKNPEKTPG